MPLVRLLVLVAGLVALGPGLAAAAPLKVVASFSIIADFARIVGGDRVAVTALVGPGGDAHVYEPRPADAATLADADLVVVNGLGFEGFLDRLVAASGTKAPVAVLSDGAELIAADEDDDHGHGHDDDGHDGHDDHGAVDPHAWQSVANAQVYVANLARALCAVDASGCDAYRANADAYRDRLADLDAEIRAAVAAIPADRRTIITPHDAFNYFARRYGIAVLAPEGVSTEAEASAADVAALIRQIRDRHATAVFLESITNPRLIEQIAAETGLTVGGDLYSDALSDASGPAPTYIDMMRHNITTITGAIAGS